MDNISMHLQIVIAVSIGLFTVLFGAGLVIWYGKQKREMEIIEKIGDSFTTQRPQNSSSLSRKEIVGVEGSPLHKKETFPSPYPQKNKSKEDSSSLKSKSRGVLRLRDYNLGESGKIYTKKELLDQIKK